MEAGARLHEAPPSSAEPGVRRPLGYQSGLDGLRALALLAIFTVHADIGLASGGFLAVSTFFTLSGFLITSLAIGEHTTTGRLDLKAFWARRARRLLPAALVAIALIVVLTVAVGASGQLKRIQGDAFAAITYLANWRYILIGDEYGARFESESPLMHFWSLAIEEQFYVLFPLVLTLAFFWWRRWKGAIVAVLVGLLVLSQAAGIYLAGRAPVDRLYFGTDVRAAELLVGALVAVWWMPRHEQLGPKLRKPLSIIAPVLLVVMAVLISSAKSSDLFWYRGGLLTYSLITCTVVVASTQRGTLMQRALSWTPLVWIGVVSYGAYLVHWPIYVWLRSSTNIGGVARLFIGAAAAIGLGTLSYLLIEHPARVTRHIPRWVLVGAPTALILIALFAAVVIPPSTAQATDLALEDRASKLSSELSKGSDSNRPRLAVFGDSTALSMAVGMATWDNEQTATLTTVDGWANLGCSIVSPAPLISLGRDIETAKECTDYLGKWLAAAAKSKPDIGLIQIGGWETCDMKLTSGGGYTALGDPAHDAEVKRHIREAAGTLADRVPAVVLVTSPHIERGKEAGGSRTYPEDDPARMDRLNELIREVVAENPRLHLVELGAYVDALANLHELRPDGVHLTWEGSDQVAAWLGPKVAEAVGKGSGSSPPG